MELSDRHRTIATSALLYYHAVARLRHFRGQVRRPNSTSILPASRTRTAASMIGLPTKMSSRLPRSNGISSTRMAHILLLAHAQPLPHLLSSEIRVNRSYKGHGPFLRSNLPPWNDAGLSPA